jgi:hypothetical protein
MVMCCTVAGTGRMMIVMGCAWPRELSGAEDAGALLPLSHGSCSIAHRWAKHPAPIRVGVCVTAFAVEERRWLMSCHTRMMGDMALIAAAGRVRSSSHRNTDRD